MWQNRHWHLANLCERIWKFFQRLEMRFRNEYTVRVMGRLHWKGLD